MPSEHERESADEPTAAREPTGRGRAVVPANGLVGYLRRTTSLLNSLVLVLPVFVLYQAGIVYQLFANDGRTYSINGADYLTRSVLRLCQGSPIAYMSLVAVVAVAFGVVLRRLGQREGVDVRLYPPMLAESLVYALLFAGLIHLIAGPTSLALHQQVPGLSLAGPSSTWDMVFQSFGAGFNEEIVFRLGILGGLVVVGRWTPLPDAVVLGIAFLVSAAAFSVFHYVGPYADAFVFDSFMYRFLAGILLGTVYWWRGLAVAVYTHAVYDLYFFSYIV